MHLIDPSRWAGLLLLLGIGVASGQSTLPSISPTGAAKDGHRANVVYSSGKLEVNADNSSLNQILRDIARETGMKITGGILDERVYGKYGPSSPADVLTNLLKGTGSNMLLRETASYAPAELILTPRQGGATPPNPKAPGYEDADQSSEPAYAPVSNQEAPGLRPGAPPMLQPGVTSTGLPQAPNAVPAPANPSDTPAANGTTDARPVDTSNPQSPNAVKTPEQVYQQLRLLQQQQQTNPK